MLLRGLHRFDDQPGRRVAERGEDAARMKPARAAPSEEVVPIEVPGLELAGGGVPAIRNAHGAAHAETALGEIQAVPHRSAHAVIRNPADERGVHPSLQDEILQQSPHVVVGKSRADRRLQSKATAKTSGDVIFAAALPCLEFARRAHASFAGIKPQHDFTQRDQVVAAGTRRFDLERGHARDLFG